MLFRSYYVQRLKTLKEECKDFEKVKNEYDQTETLCNLARTDRNKSEIFFKEALVDVNISKIVRHAFPWD